MSKPMCEIIIDKTKTGIQSIKTCCSGMANIISRNTLTFVIDGSTIKMIQPSKLRGGIININSSEINSILTPHYPFPLIPTSAPAVQYPTPLLPPINLQPTNTQRGLNPDITMEFCPKCGGKINIILMLETSPITE
ncbi:hypothetical protein KAW18_03980 [candidate division WOR-3 bacterium]|nr:hypothetical protein [candidate division WOR-3 bacterium]